MPGCRSGVAVYHYNVSDSFGEFQYLFYLFQLPSMSPVLSKYILAAKNLVSLYSSSRSTTSVLDSCVTSTASIFLLGLLWRPGFCLRGRCRCYLKLIFRPFCGCTDRVLVWICRIFLVRLVSLICRSQAWSVGDLFACTLWVPVFCLCYVNS